jgi:hypothetical protein
MKSERAAWIRKQKRANTREYRIEMAFMFILDSQCCGVGAFGEKENYELENLKLEAIIKSRLEAFPRERSPSSAKNANQPKLVPRKAPIIIMFWKNLTHIPRKHPLAFGLAISTVKTSVCDLLVQTKFEKKDEIDWRRNIFFGAFGFAYKRNIVEDNLACWKVWVPAMFINFSVMPMWARIPWVTTVSFMWTCIISSMRGGEIANEKLERNDSIYV